MDDGLAICPGCGARVPDVRGPMHVYLGANAGCWRIYGEILAREYQDFRYARVHSLTVDAYAVQHPGARSRQTIQSVAVHLVSLYAVFEAGIEPWETVSVKQGAAEQFQSYIWLDPPAGTGSLTVRDVHTAEDPRSHTEAVWRWSREAWSSWARHHGTIEEWARLVWRMPE